MIVLDASVLIAHLDANDAHHERASALLLALADEPLRASPITLAEVLVAPARAARLDAAKVGLRTLGVTAVPFRDDAPERLASLRASTGLKLPDCCVLHAAEVACAGLATFDDQLVSAARGRGVHVREN